MSEAVRKRPTFLIAILLPWLVLLICGLGRLKPALFPPYVLDLSFLLFSLAALVVVFGAITIPLVLVSALCLRRPPSSASTVTLAFLSSSVIVFLVFWVARQHIPRGLPNGSYQLPFDAEDWRKESSFAHALSISVREKMLGDVVENVLPGKTRAEIEELLGASLQTRYFTEVDNDLIYYLGRQRDSGINIDSEWLLIWLDQNERFERVEIVND